MSALDVNTLLDEAKCYACFDPESVTELSKLAILARISQGISFIGLGTFIDATTRTSFSFTPDFIPSENSLLLALIVANNAVTIPTMVGNSITWVNIATLNFAGGRRMTVFRAFTSNPFSIGGNSVDFGGTNTTGCLARFVQFFNVNSSGTNGSGAVVQSAIANILGAPNPSITLATLNANGKNGMCVFSGNSSNPFSGTPKTGWTEDADIGLLNVLATGLYSAFKLNASGTDNVASITSVINNFGIFAAEIKSVLS